MMILGEVHSQNTPNIVPDGRFMLFLFGIDFRQQPQCSSLSTCQAFLRKQTLVSYSVSPKISTIFTNQVREVTL